MRWLVLLTLLFSTRVSAAPNLEQRIAIFTQQMAFFKQLCFLPDGSFTKDRIIFDAHSSITETAFDCNAQALALDEEQKQIEQQMQDDHCPTCYSTLTDRGLIDLLNGNSAIVQDLTCPGAGDAVSCMENISCNLLSSIIPFGAAAAHFTFKNHPTLNRCGQNGTNCLTNIGKAIWDNLWDTVTGLYDLGKMAVGWMGDKIGSWWRAENATSTRGIAATEINDSQLSQFMSDPVNYIYNFGKALINMMTDSISKRYGCVEWTGAPYISECVQPMSWDCGTCNEKLNMFCGVAGYVGANIVTTFFTGGASAAVQITGKLAGTAIVKVARVIPGAEEIARAMSVAGKVGRVGLISKGLRGVWAAVRASKIANAITTVAGKLKSAGHTLNEVARGQIFLYASAQDTLIGAARGYNRLAKAAFNAGYRLTGDAANRTQSYLLNQYVKLTDVQAGRFKNVHTAEDYLREATRNMSAADRRNMAVTVTTDAKGQQRVVVYDKRAGQINTDIKVDLAPAPTTPITPTPPVAAIPKSAPTEVETIVVTAPRRRPAGSFLNQNEVRRVRESLTARGIDLDNVAELSPQVLSGLSDKERIYLLEDILQRPVDKQLARTLLRSVENNAETGLDATRFAERQNNLKLTLISKGTAPEDAARIAQEMFDSGLLGKAPRSAVGAEVRTAGTATVSVDNFISEWASKKTGSVEENMRYIGQAQRGLQDGWFYLDAQNTMLKKLNDSLRNKALVDALGNRYNYLVKNALETFKAKYPQLEVQLYSDYKSIRAAIRGPPSQTESLMQELSGLIDNANASFMSELAQAGYLPPDFSLSIFKAGLGRTADEANLVTRFSRRDGDTATSMFAAQEVQDRIKGAWQLAQTTRARIANKFRGTPLLKQVEGTNMFVPEADVLEVVRKNSSDAEVAAILTRRYGVNVKANDATLLRQYFNQVDQFSPGLLISERVEHRFDKAVNGGYTVDFAGVGSLNAEATAVGLAEGRNLSDTIVSIRRQEMRVTAELDRLKDQTRAAINQVLERHGIKADITISGDDMLVVPNKPLTPELRSELLQAQVQAQAGTYAKPKDIRTAFFAGNIADQPTRSIQATIGESLEKKLRSRLETLLPQSDLRQTSFAVNMNGTTAGTGTAQLDILNPNLSPQARKTIQREFGRAIQDVNKDLKANQQVGELVQ